MKGIIFIISCSILLSQDCDAGYTYIPASEIPFTTTSLPFDSVSGEPYTCFNDDELSLRSISQSFPQRMAAP